MLTPNLDVLAPLFWSGLPAAGFHLHPFFSQIDIGILCCFSPNF